VLLRLPEKKVGTGPSTIDEMNEHQLRDLIGFNDRNADLDRLDYYELNKLAGNMGLTDADVVDFYRKGMKVDSESNFRNQPWDQPNVLAHLRMSDRTGPNGEKILHLEELQSDWAQKGRKEGFRQPPATSLPEGTKSYPPGEREQNAWT